MKSSLFVVWLALAATAQAGEAGHADSTALQIAHAAYFERLRDSTAADLAAAARSAGDNHMRGSAGAMAGIAAGTAAGVFSPVGELSPGAMIGFSSLSALAQTLPVGHPEAAPRVIAWLPHERAATAAAAQAVMSELLITAVRQAMPEASVELVRAAPKSRKQNYLAIDSPRCIQCSLVSHLFDDRKLPKLEQLPAAVGGTGAAWVWGHPQKQGDGLFGFPWFNQTLTPPERMEHLLAISAHLPADAHVYFYFPPDRRLTASPVMLHQGTVLWFVEAVVEPRLAEADQQK